MARMSYKRRITELLREYELSSDDVGFLLS